MYEKEKPRICEAWIHMVEQKLLTANTIYANSVEIKLTRNWLAVITFCESPNKKS